MIWFERKAANSFSFHWQTAGGWHSGKTDALHGKTCALAKMAFWQNWRSGKTGAMAKLALWQNWRSGKTGALAKLTSTLLNWRSGNLALWQN